MSGMLYFPRSHEDLQDLVFHTVALQSADNRTHQVRRKRSDG